jgi:hypothetical protein
MNHKLTMPSLRAWVLYFGYSLREELPLQFPQDSMDAPAGVAASTKRMTIGD